LIETIKFRNGTFHLLSYHVARANYARKVLFGIDQPLFLNKINPPENLKKDQTYKCRVVYDKSIQQVRFREYQYKPAYQLQCVYDDELKYDHKYENRRQIEDLSASKGDSDDIIIIRDNLVTDAAYSNLAFLKSGNWYTPEHPLLKGTKRAYYLDIGCIIPEKITPKDLYKFEAVCRINAFMDLSLENALPTDKISL